MTSMGAARARVAVASEWRELGETLGAAFHDDPLWAWIAPDASRRDRLMGLLFAQLIRRRVAEGTGWSVAGGAGAAVWAAPGTWKARPGEVARMASPMLRLVGPGLIRSRLEAFTTMEKLHPSGPHWYLEIIGTDPTRRGQGLGGALMEPMIERCDAEGADAYLESSKEANLAFYHRFGFEVRDEVTLAPGAPPVWPMWRPAR